MTQTKKPRRRAERPGMTLEQAPGKKRRHGRRLHLPAPKAMPALKVGDVVVWRPFGKHFFNTPEYVTVVRIKRETHAPNADWNYTVRYQRGGLTSTTNPERDTERGSFLFRLLMEMERPGFDDYLPVRLGDRVLLHDQTLMGGCRGVIVEKTRNLMHGHGRVFGVRIEEPGPWGEHREHVGYVYHFQRRLVRRLTKMELLAEAPFRSYDGKVQYMSDRRSKVVRLFMSVVNQR